MPTTAERRAGRRLALVIATGSYADPDLAKLRAPGRDASDLAAVLEDAAIGGFEVERVVDAAAESMRRQVAAFCAAAAPSDLILVYLSCHGVLDDRGRLYYATTDTDRSLLSATALSSAWLNEQLEDCRGRQQILVLDCCHSGAFAKGAKGAGDLALGERFEGRGRVVLTGSRGTEYSFEHDQVVGEGTSSVFTGALIEGLRSGDADRDGDGVVSVSELYEYTYDVVRSTDAPQTPTLWTYGAEGDLAVARSPRGVTGDPPSPPPASQRPRPPGEPPEERPGSRGAGIRRGRIAIAAAAAGVVVLAAALLAITSGGSAARTAISVDGSPRGIVAAEGAAWVTRYDGGKVSKIDPATGAVLKSFTVGYHPSEITAGERSVWMTVADHRNLATIGPGKVVSETKVHEPEGCECPLVELATAPGKLLASSPGNFSIAVFDLRSGHLTGGPYYAGPNFDGAFTMDGSLIWAIGNDHGAAWVRRIDSDSGDHGERKSLQDGSEFSGVAFGDGTVWISDSAHNLVVPFDPDNLEFGPGIEVEHGVSGEIAFFAGEIVVWNPENGWLTRIDPKSRKTVETFRIDAFPVGNKLDRDASQLSLDSEFAWVTDPSQNLVHRIRYQPSFDRSS